MAVLPRSASSCAETGAGATAAVIASNETKPNVRDIIGVSITA